jgi:hypothetical protein
MNKLRLTTRIKMSSTVIEALATGGYSKQARAFIALLTHQTVDKKCIWFQGSYRDVAKRLGISETLARRAIKEVTDSGFVTTLPCTFNHSRGTQYAFTELLNYKNVPELAGENSHQGTEVPY